MLSKFSSLQLVKNIDFFEESKDGVQRNIPEQHSQRICMNIFLSGLISSWAEQCVLKKAIRCMGYKREDLLLSIGKSESYMNGQYVAGIEPSLFFSQNYRMSGICLFLDWSCAVSEGDNCPNSFARVKWCNCSNVVLNRRKRCIVWDVTINGILSSRVCCQIATNAYMTRDPDENNLLSISDQIWVQFVNFYQNRITIFHVM